MNYNINIFNIKKVTINSFLSVALIALIVAVAAFTTSGCKDFVQSVESPINSLDDNQLNSEDHINFLITGVRGEMANTIGQLQVNSGGISDELVFDRRIQGATYPTYGEFETGDILYNNSNSENSFSSLSRLRLMADTLVTRINKMTFKDSLLRNKGLFTGYLYGGLARYYMGAYFGLEQEKGGATISSSPFIPSKDLFSAAITKLNSAATYAATIWDKRVINSLIARIHLMNGDYAAAESAAANGLQQGDEDMVSLYSTTTPTEWFYAAGNGRIQFALDNRFKAYVDADPKEASRIMFDKVTGSDGSTEFIRQQRYPQDNSSLPAISWQENELMLAECLVRKNEQGNAITHINKVRSSHTLDERSSTNLDSIYIERDKELYCTGNRLLDQRRFNRWHLPTGTWKYMPIPQSERSRNPNLK